MDDAERRQQQALERQRHSHQLARQRATEADQRRSERTTEAQLGEIDAMRLKHELDIENRGLDHQFNRAEDARELERQATETVLRRRDDFIRKAWDDDVRGQELEALILGKIADYRIAKRQETQRHDNLMAEKSADHINHMEGKAADHYNSKELSVVKDELDKGNFEFKERLKIQLAREFGTVNRENINETIDRMFREGKFG